MSYFQDLFPNLASRRQSKQAQGYEDRRHALSTLKQTARNETAYLQQVNEVRAQARHNKRVSENFFKEVEARSLNQAASNKASLNAQLERHVGKEAAAGMRAVQEASRGTGGLSEQINQAQAFRVAQVEGMVADQEKAHKFNQVGSVAGWVNSAFSQVSLGVPMVALDFTQDKRKVFGSKSFAKGLLKDVGRLVATYYGGTMARDAIDAYNGHEEKYQAREQAVQGALDSLYGQGVVRNRTASRPQFSAIVGGLGNGGGGWQQGLTTAFTNQKQGSNSGWTGQQYGQVFQGLSNLWANQGSSQAPRVLNAGSQGFQGFSMNGFGGGTKQVGGSSWDFSQFKNFNWSSFFGGK